jgi:cell fate regulator YaaT (PSP1 superfamily)
LQLKKYRVREDSEEISPILRVANEKDMEKYEIAKAKENATLEKARTISFELNLAMKISDIEFQGDGRKVIFFYTAESRVDFRELIKRYADEFKVKIEMRHISYREEASRLGGIGVCGRELCCSSWLTDYKQVNTGAARSQNLSINMEKLAGQCGRLKCCLNFELDMYLEATEAFPKAKIVKIDTVTGVAYARKTDILKQLIWFSYDDNPAWIPLPVALVNECMESNKNGIQSATLSDLAPANEILDKIIADEKANDFIDNAELLKDNEFGSLKKLDSKGPRDRNNNNRNKNNNNRREGSGSPQNRPNQNKPGFNNNRPNSRPANNNNPTPNVDGSVVNTPKPNNPNPQNPNQPNRNPNKHRKPFNKNKGPRNNEGGNNPGGNTPPSAPPQS